MSQKLVDLVQDDDFVILHIPEPLDEHAFLPAVLDCHAEVPQHLLVDVVLCGEQAAVNVARLQRHLEERCSLLQQLERLVNHKRLASARIAGHEQVLARGRIVCLFRQSLQLEQYLPDLLVAEPCGFRLVLVCEDDPVLYDPVARWRLHPFFERHI
nr:hypothetical protein [Ferrimicrobium acidiphilum]